ncbi:hypothetical protein ES703_45267 [subsurface metagenome]
MVTPAPTKEKTDIERLMELRNLLPDRILDLQLTVGNPGFSDQYRMSARARIEELEWVQSIIG